LTKGEKYMKKNKIYKYLGRNGSITSPILLEKIDPIPMLYLIADEGKILTNGMDRVKAVNVFLDELEEWYEIDDPSVKNQ
jgi:hypothetical protein